MKTNKLFTFLLVALALLVLPLLLQQGGNAWVRILDMALLYVLLALGLTSWSATPACWTWVMWLSLPWAHICLRCLARRTWPKLFRGSQQPFLTACTCRYGR